MKKLLCFGSIVYDHLFDFDGRFSDSLKGVDLRALSLCLRTRNHVMRFGGCGANIAYNLALLGDVPVLTGVVGRDFEEFAQHLTDVGVNIDFVESDVAGFTASAFIMTDVEENQLGIFSPGAADNEELCMDLDPTLQKSSVDCAIISPANPVRMVALARRCLERGIPYLFDPGQALPSLGKEQLSECVDGAIGLIVNEMEGELVEQKLGIKLHGLASDELFVVKTMGANGCVLFRSHAETIIPAIEGIVPLDVTGVGDAFRAGFLYSYVRNEALESCCRLGSVVASYALKGVGGQEHFFSFADISSDLNKHYS